MRIYVTPAAGKSVRNPNRPADGYLPAEGQIVEDSQAWRRLARAGDVTISAEAQASAPATGAPATGDSKKK